MRCLRHGAMIIALGAVTIFVNDGCALITKADLVDIRYFSPERVEAELTDGPPTAPLDASLRVRLGRVGSGSNLRERIAYRNTAFELGHYEELRWTERPERYVRREVGRSLFEVHGMHRVLDGEAPTLDIEVLAFDDMRLSAGRMARVQLRIILYEESGVLFEYTLAVDRPVVGDNPKIEDVVAAMASALDAAAEDVSLRVQKALSAKMAESSKVDVP